MFEDELTKNNLSNSLEKNNFKKVESYKKQIKKLSYEDSIKALESILANIQDENISLDKIKINYIKGHLLLKHCEELLAIVEQEVNEINLENLNMD